MGEILTISALGAEPIELGRSQPRKNLEHGAFGSRMAASLNPDHPSKIHVQTLQTPRLVVTRFRSQAGLPELSATIPREAAFVVVLQLKRLRYHELWQQGALVHGGPCPSCGVTILDLERDPRVNYLEPFHALQFYVTRAVLDELTDACGAKRLEKLRWPSGAIDETIGHLGWAMVEVLENPQRSSLLFLDHVANAINTHFAYAYGGMRARPAIERGRLVPWQERRYKEILADRLAERTDLGELADECRVSASRMAFALQRANGKSPHRRILERQVEKAKDMLVDFRLSIAEVAVASGFADQSHLIEVFSELVGASPVVWRRMSKN
jgi:AraC-like DNA-binding protein